MDPKNSDPMTPTKPIKKSSLSSTERRLQFSCDGDKSTSKILLSDSRSFNLSATNNPEERSSEPPTKDP